MPFAQARDPCADIDLPVVLHTGQSKGSVTIRRKKIKAAFLDPPMDDGV